MSLAVLSATDVLTAYLPVIGEDRAIAPTTIGLLLSLRAAATIACRLVMTPMIRWLGRTALMAASCASAGVLCGGLVLPVPVWALAAMLLALGFCLGVGQPLSMTTVVQAAPERARSTALALRLTGNRLGQVAAPAGAGLLAGVAGTAAPFALLGGLLVASAVMAARTGRGRGGGTAGRGSSWFSRRRPRRRIRRCRHHTRPPRPERRCSGATGRGPCRCAPCRRGP